MRFVTRIADIIIRYPRTIILFFSIVTLVMAEGTTYLETHNNYDGDLPSDDPIVRANARFEEVFGNEQMMMVAVEDTGPLSLQCIEKIRRISDALATVDGVPDNGVISLSTVPAPHLGRHLVSDDGTTALILVRIARTASQSVVAGQVDSIVTHHEGPERIYTIGDHTLAEEVDDGIEADLRTLLPIALVLIVVGFYVCFRTLLGVVLPLLVILGSIVWTLGLMGYLGFRVNVVTSAIPILLVATASSYGIHVIHRFNGEGLRGVDAVRNVLRRLGPAVLLTGVTSAIGTLTLLLFRITSIREFGIFASIGIASATVLAVVLLPAILVLQKRPPCRRVVPTAYPLARSILLYLGTFSLRHSRIVFVTATLLMVVAGAGVSRIRLGIDPVELFPEQHAFQEAAAVFNTRFSGWRYFDVMVAGPEADSVKTPEFLRAIQGFQRAAGELELVGSSRSVIDVFRDVHSALGRDGAIPFVIPESRRVVGRVFDLYASIDGGEEATRWVDEERRRARITVMVTTSDHEEQIELYRRLKDLSRIHFPDYNVEFGGMVLLWIAGNHYVAIGKIYNITATVLLVFVFCALAFRCVSNGLLTVVPLVIAGLVTFGTMGFFGIRLNMGTAIITSVGVGIGVDFAIHFFSRLREELTRGLSLDEATTVTLLTAGKAICFDVASNVLGFIVFVLSEFSTIQYLGWLVSLMMVVTALGTLVLLPPLVALFGPRDRMSRRQTAVD